MNSMDWLVKDKPSLPVNPNDIHFIKTPTEFYETIIVSSLECDFIYGKYFQERIKTAKKQIILASLYLGTGELEVKLVRYIFF